MRGWDLLAILGAVVLTVISGHGENVVRDSSIQPVLLTQAHAAGGREVLPGKWKKSASIADRPDINKKNDFYGGNREPLLPVPFMKLPVGSIRPRGWLLCQLRLQADGFVGHLADISEFLVKEDNAWLSADGQGKNHWEEVPYWLKGFGDLGYVLGNERIIEEAREWIEGIIASQRDDGYFGPRKNLHEGLGGDGKPDLWPNMIALNVLQSYYEFSGDARVLDLMEKYFQWQLRIPEEDFLPPYWQKQRAADNLVSVYWLYNRTGEKSLLELAEKIHRNTANWTDGIPNWHNVNIAQAFRGPAIYYQQSHDVKHLKATERNYQTVRKLYGQVPGGMFGGDENCREGFSGPRQAIETCGIVEMMLSDEMLLKMTGDPIWADRCEDVALNTFPPSMTADLRALHYLTAPNMVLCDGKSKAPGLQNRGPMLLFDPHGHRCCQHNVSHGWPYYAEHLWLATAGNGLAAVLYADSIVRAKVGDGRDVTVEEWTDYPFDEKVEFMIELDGNDREKSGPVRFPLYLRVPGWCDSLTLTVKGEAAPLDVKPASYIKIDRDWMHGDMVRIDFDADVRMTRWIENGGSVSIHRGALTYSLKIGEELARAGGTDDWPAYEIYPKTPWNYGLILDEDDLSSSFTVVRKSCPDCTQPFETESSPVELRVEAKRIPGWKIDRLGLVGKMQPGPIRSEEPVETVTLIPMGCARLRISAFPAIAEGPEAHEWRVE